MLARENQRQNFLFENTRESQQKKKYPDLDQLQSRSLFFSLLIFSPLSSSSSFLACSNTALLLQATLFSSLLFFSLLSSSSSSLACSNAALLLQATLPRCWEPENGRARTARARNQRTAVPVPPVQGTKERPCPFHPCRGPESRPAFCDGPGPTPSTVGLVGGNPRVQECWAGPGRPSVTDPSSVTDRQEN